MPDAENILFTAPMGCQTLRREGDPKVWSTVYITALGSWEKLVPRIHTINIFTNLCVKSLQRPGFDTNSRNWLEFREGDP
jgi:hypothetical protein